MLLVVDRIASVGDHLRLLLVSLAKVVICEVVHVMLRPNSGTRPVPDAPIRTNL